MDATTKNDLSKNLDWSPININPIRNCRGIALFFYPRPHDLLKAKRANNED